MSAPVAAFGIFIMGVIIIMISVIGSFAVQIESRGLLKLVMFIMFFFAFCFIGFGAAGLIQVSSHGLPSNQGLQEVCVCLCLGG